MVAVLEVGDRVHVISYGPFRGLKGSVKKVHDITIPNAEELFCFYYIELEATQIGSPVWFQNSEVEVLPILFA